ncbi:hypothetical protein VaNZ11_011933 [Volvox africanus]|uniref:F-box domain-containing protein n=1 Tax=Volvox africanus TaxID=51714 RepID=A0ABQ5SEH4_9CHLO|nr:hypothetical protein VaNZ11_011933 [Volvox africanus]
MAQTDTNAEKFSVYAMNILDLPDMVLIGILRFLGPRDIVVFGSVCKRFFGPATEDRIVWGPICQAIVGSVAAASPDAWHVPSFQRLYCRVLRTYGALLAGPWCGQADPLGSLLVAFPSPPYIIGGIVTSLKLAEPGVTVVPVFRVSYESLNGDASVSCLRGRNMFDSLLQRLATLENQSTGHQPLMEEEDPFEAEGIHMAKLQLRFEEDAPGGLLEQDMTTAAAFMGGAGGSAESGSAPTQVQPLLTTMQAGARDAEEGAGASIVDARNAQPGTAAAAGLQHTDCTSQDVLRAMARRPHPYCWGGKRNELCSFTFRCSGCCRQQELEAVCRWAPAGTVTRLSEVTALSAGAAAFTPDSRGAAGSSSADGGRRRSNTGIDNGGDLPIVDLDVLEGHSFHERVQRVVVTLYGLMNQKWNGSVTYSRLHPAEQSLRADPDEVEPVVTGRDVGLDIADSSSVRISQSAVVNPGHYMPRPGDIEAATGCGPGARDLLAAPRCFEAIGKTRVQLPLISAAHPLVGIWRGTYGTHGIEHVILQHTGPQLLEARKLTGDSNIPAGETSFRIFLDKPGPYAAQKGHPFRLPPDYESRAELTFPGRRGDEPGHGTPSSGAVRRKEVLVLDGFGAQGQVAGIMYSNPQWINAEAVVLGRNTFGVLWCDLQSFSAFRRVQLHEGCPR